MICFVFRAQSFISNGFEVSGNFAPAPFPRPIANRRDPCRILWLPDTHQVPVAPGRGSCGPYIIKSMYSKCGSPPNFVARSSFNSEKAL